jgi:hypothetical protein
MCVRVCECVCVCLCMYPSTVPVPYPVLAVAADPLTPRRLAGLKVCLCLCVCVCVCGRQAAAKEGPRGIPARTRLSMKRGKERASPERREDGRVPEADAPPARRTSRNRLLAAPAYDTHLARRTEPRRARPEAACSPGTRPGPRAARLTSADLSRFQAQMRAEVLPQLRDHSAVLTPNQGSLPLTYTPRFLRCRAPGREAKARSSEQTGEELQRRMGVHVPWRVKCNAVRASSGCTEVARVEPSM